MRQQIVRLVGRFPDLNRFNYRSICLLAIFSWIACAKAQRHSDPQALAKNSPTLIVEGYIEYPGPNDQWAGPASFLVHMSTWEADSPQISVLPALTEMAQPPAIPHLTVQEVREDLARLKGLMDEPTEKMPNCLFPVQIKLIQADGVLFEKKGCRGEKGWPRVASEIAQNLMKDLMVGSKKN